MSGILSAIQRPSMSLIAPGGYGTTTRIGRFGKPSWACTAGAESRLAAPAPSTARRLIRIVFPPGGGPSGGAAFTAC